MKAAILATAAIIALVPQPFLSAPDILTTGLKSAVMDVAYLDNQPEPEFQNLASLEREPDGTFVLKPGGFEMEFESFCLLPGTHGPARGDGFLFAPLAGRGASIIQAVLDRSLQHPDIPQERIQQLLWAILAQASFTDLSRELKQAAASLLTAREIADLQGWSAAGLRDRLRSQLTGRAPEPLRQVLEAHSRLRDLLADASATYEQMRDVAVLQGRPEPQAGDREIPEGRWSYHPDGYFIRFRPEHFSRTRVQLLVPAGTRAAIARDSKGRVIRATYTDGLIVEADYDDAIPALTVPGDPGIRGYAFKRLRFSADGEVAEVLNDGWTFAGRSNARGDESKLPGGESGYAGGENETPSGPLDRAQAPTLWDRYKGAKARYGKAKALQKEAEARQAREDRARRGPSERDVDDLTDEGHYREGYEKAKGGDLGAKLDWLKKHMGKNRNAAEYIHCRLRGGCDDADDPPKKEPPKKWKPGGAALPGAQGGQRLGIGSRPAR